MWKNMEAVCRNVLSLFEHLPVPGLQKIVQRLNPAKEKGTYLIQTGINDLNEKIGTVLATKQLDEIVNLIEFVPLGHQRSETLVKTCKDEQYQEALERSSPATHMVLCVWTYTQDPTPDQEYGCNWGILAFM